MNSSDTEGGETRLRGPADGQQAGPDAVQVHARFDWKGRPVMHLELDPVTLTALARGEDRSPAGEQDRG